MDKTLYEIRVARLEISRNRFISLLYTKTGTSSPQRIKKKRQLKELYIKIKELEEELKIC